MRHIVTFYGYDVGRLPHSSPEWRARYLELFGTADLLLCEGPFMAQTLVQLGCSAEKIKVHHLGIDTHSIVFQPRSWSPGDPLRVLLSGTFTEKKGLTYAIRALSKLAKSVPLQVIVIGDADERPDRQQEKRRILATVEQTNMSDRIRFLGFQPHRDLIRIASGCHIFLSPSVTASDGDSEGGAPVSIIEMAASGMPVVSTRHCDIPEVLEDGVSGLLADERDVNGLAEKLQWLVDHPDAWAFIAANARRRIEAEFDATTQGLRLVELYDAVVGAL